METPINQSPPFILPNPTVDNTQEVDTLSLRDLPTTVDPPPYNSHQNNHSRRSSSSSSSDPTSDFFFEFLINNDDDLITSSADDVIFRGRLLPYAPPHHAHPRRSLSLSSRLTRHQLTESNSESLPSSIRPSKSLNYRKLHRNHHHHHHHHHHHRHHRSNSNSKHKSDFLLKNTCNNNNNSEKLINSSAKSPWYWLIFGLPKIPAEMELKDIKNRQYRRNITTAAKAFSGEKSCGSSSSSSASWRFLSVLSCKSHATVDVNHTPPFRTTSLM